MTDTDRDFQNLIDRLIANKSDVSFFQAIRLLLRTSNTTLGRQRKPSQESIQLRSEPSVVFPRSEIGSITQPKGRHRRAAAAADAAAGDSGAGESVDESNFGEKGSDLHANGKLGKPTIEATFFGLYGHDGALPTHYTQLIIDRLRSKDSALRDFLDLFNHRLLSLFYRVWEKYHAAVAFETATNSGEPDLLSECLLGLVGFGTKGLRNRQLSSDHAWLHYAGLKALRGPRPDALANILADHFRMNVEVRSFQGEWLRIPEPEQSRLGTARFGESLGNALGIDTVAGSRVWAIEHRFRVIVGPISRKEFFKLLPISSKFREMGQIVRTYVGPSLDFDIQVILDCKEVPLTSNGGIQAGRLGWNTWLGQWRSPHHAEDAVFACEGMPELEPHRDGLA